MKSWILPAVLAVAAVTAACGGGATIDTGRGEPTSKPRDTTTKSRPDRKGAAPAHDFSVETFDGQRWALAAQKGRPVILNFWESW